MRHPLTIKALILALLALLLGPTDGLAVSAPPSFEIHTLTSSTTSVAESMVPADLDLDGPIDLVAAFPAADEILWYQNTGGPAPGFAPQFVTGQAIGVESVDAEDLDGDGDIDIIAALTEHGRIVWYENLEEEGDEPPRFSPEEGIEIGTFPAVNSVRAADLDNDGDIDLAAAGADGVVWLENDGDENFTEHTVKNLMDDIREARHVIIDDIDSDGLLDIVSANFIRSGEMQDDTVVEWYENDGDIPPSFASRVVTTDPIVEDVTSLHTTDFNGDGTTDLIWVRLDETDGIPWWSNDNSGALPIFERRTIESVFGDSKTVYVADLDGDLDQDVIAGETQGQNRVAWHDNQGGDVFSGGVLLDDPLPEGESAFITAADLNGDGQLDIIVSSEPNDISWYENIPQVCVELVCPCYNLCSGGPVAWVLDVDNPEAEALQVIVRIEELGGGPQRTLLQTELAGGETLNWVDQLLLPGTVTDCPATWRLEARAIPVGGGPPLAEASCEIEALAATD